MTKPQEFSLNRRIMMIDRLAPTAPPCFDSRSQWVEYLQAVLLSQASADSEPSPLTIERSNPVTFNHAFNVCTDCTREYSAKMEKAGRCEPGYLKGLAKV
jgi:hypothetical protein